MVFVVSTWDRNTRTSNITKKFKNGISIWKLNILTKMVARCKYDNKIIENYD